MCDENFSISDYNRIFAILNSPPVLTKYPYKVLIACFLLFLHADVVAQYAVNMSGYTRVYTCQHPSGTIYDDGGNYDYYSNLFDGYVVIVSSAGASISLSGSYNTEPGSDYIMVYDGDYASGSTLSGSILVNNASGSGTISTVSRTGFLTIYFHSNESTVRGGFSLHYSCTGENSSPSCNNTITGLTATNITDNSAFLRWNATNPGGPFLVEVNGRALIANANRISLSHLNPATSYTVSVLDLSDSLSLCCAAFATFVTECISSASNCIDYADLYSSNVTCRQGTVSRNSTYNATYTIGIVDNGPSSSTSRHTVHTNTHERDSRTNSILRTVPEGFCSSVRLGNWNTHRETEQITYRYSVDTNINNLLIMKYAAVLQDPNHSRVSQPRFSFTITNMQGQSISQCYNADFIANPSLGWNLSGSNVLWKDWTTVGIDLAPLHGQTINITLSTYDCTQGGHYGYAYFVFQCTNKVLTSESCTSEENTFHAPAGFNYRWYRQDDPSVTLSTQDTLHVTRAGTYICNLSFIGAPVSGCSFNMSAISGIRYPWARFTASVVEWSDCVPIYRFSNNSIITLDSGHDTLTSQGCESYLWTIDDSVTYTDINPLIPMEPGRHTVRLEAMIANGSCTDTVDTVFFVSSPCLQYDTLDITICAGGSYRLFDTLLTTSGTYERDSNYHFRVVNLTVNAPFQGSESDTACDRFLWPVNGREYLQSGIYCDTLTTVHGCDSVVTLNLTINPSTSATFFDTCVENQLPRHFLDIVAHGDTSQAFVTIANADGCDSTIDYHLKVHWNTYRTMDSTVCDNQLPALWRDLIFADAGVQMDTISNMAGADSIMTLQLHVLPTYIQHVYDTICNNRSAVFENNIYTQAGNYSDTLLTQTNPQCDSIRMLHLFVKDTSVGDTMAMACDFFHWYGRNYSASTIDSLNRHYQNAVGCDSTVVLHLNIYPTYNIPFADTIYYGDTLFFEDSLYTEADTYYTHHYTSIHGCDSLHTLHLLGKRLIVDYRIDSMCVGGTYDFYGRMLLDSGIYRDTVVTSDISIPDTSVFLTLVVLPVPKVSIDSDLTCYRRPHYNLYGHTDAPYSLWSASRYEAGVENHEHDSILDVCPQQPTMYYYMADYRPKPLCPVSDSILITPLDTIEARIHSVPGFYTFEQRNVVAVDSSRGHVLLRQWHCWYAENILSSSTARVLNFDVEQFVDSIMLVLTVSSSQCSDTDTLVVREYREDIFFPNVFTPSLGTNNTFGGVSSSVLDYELWIFDRRGVLMFHTDDISVRWDGTSNGHVCPMGNYVYYCLYTNKTMPQGKQTTHGSVLLLR